MPVIRKSLKYQEIQNLLANSSSESECSDDDFDLPAEDAASSESSDQDSDDDDMPPPGGIAHPSSFGDGDQATPMDIDHGAEPLVYARKSLPAPYIPSIAGKNKNFRHPEICHHHIQAWLPA